MRYESFFQNFYIRNRTTGIKNCNSQGSIAEFFMRETLPEDKREQLTFQPNAFTKYYEGKRGGLENWSIIKDSFDKQTFINIVQERLNDTFLNLIMERFGIQLIQGEGADPELFSKALAEQFYAIAAGGGEAESIVASYYREDANLDFYPVYASGAEKRYEYVDGGLYDGGNYLIDDVFVCNELGSIEGTIPNRSRHGTTIKDATLELVAEYSRKVILIGNGGMGKSMMLQHLFLGAIREHSKTGFFPIFIELRHYSPESNNMMKLILTAVQRHDPSFNEECAKRVLASGKCQLLLDGVDEIDPGAKLLFQKELSEFVDKYKYSQYVMTSRRCDIIRSIRGFDRLFLRGFDKEQSLLLINKLLPLDEDKAIREKIIEYMDKGFLRAHREFATNPMLLTFILMKYPKVDLLEDNQLKFYRSAYKTIVSGHDEHKEAYDRIFRSVSDSEEFTNVFREFCGMSYKNCTFEFNEATFEDYYNGLTSIIALKEPGMMSMKKFRHDVCATACMMYEQQDDIFYIDQGFQEYLFAEYTYHTESENMERMGRELWKVPLSEYEGDSAFQMLYDQGQIKTEICFFLPFLREIFAGKSDDVAFLHFLLLGYGTLKYNRAYTEIIEAYKKEEYRVVDYYKTTLNQPSTVILSMIYKICGIDGDFEIQNEDENIYYEECEASVYIGMKTYDLYYKQHGISMRQFAIDDYEEWNDYAQLHDIRTIILDSDGKAVCFGEFYEFDCYLLLEEPDKYQEIKHLLLDEGSKVHKAFKRLKRYYKDLVSKHEKGRYANVD